MSRTSSRTPRGPHYDVNDSTGPNAESLKAAIPQSKTEEQRRTEKPKPYPFQSEIEELDRELAAHHAEETKDTARKPAPGAENRANVADPGRRNRSGTVYGIRWQDDPGAIPGEPEAAAEIMFPADEADAEHLEAEAMRLVTVAKLAWTRQEILNLRAELKGIEQHSEDAKQIKAGVLAAMKELLPMAKRNAKRGSPALLRLIAKVIKTKL